MRKTLKAGDSVRHHARDQWGIGKIISIHSCGTIKVIFEENKILSIAKGKDCLIKVDDQGNKI